MHQRPSLHFLMIEDDPDTAELIGVAISERYTDASVTHCETLAQIAEVDLDKIDLVLCDFHLPDGDGLDALRLVLERRDDALVVMVTGQLESGAAVEAIRRGAVDYLVKFNGYLGMIPILIEKNLEIGRIRRDNHRLQAALSKSLAELKNKNRSLAKAAEQLETLASTDLLTGLANRRRLEDRLHEMFTESLRYKNELSCMMIDLDGFKAINDTMGHQAGDELLHLTGDIITEEIRSSDLGARYGGDEFFIALSHADEQTAVAMAIRLQQRFETQAAHVLGDRVRCGMSIGIARLSRSNPLDPHQLMAHADNALYAAKSSGKSQIMVCGADGKTASSPALNDSISARNSAA